ncbi:MAG: hypothetical protein M1830_001804 [Pleopsidium flavum]|nr:MAG: hypothetical protein M1830_002161 [Pleopsidium flavum]KAI9872297.1 MAG: hypothetical protein M1830_001804 [Pleopsidium flavum]
MSILTGNKFDPNTDIPDLTGKNYIVTGGSAGIGFGIVAHLLQHNAQKILLLSNKEEHAEQAMEELKQWGDASKVHWVKCNLEDLKQVDEVAKKLKSEEKQIDALICNAGLGVGVYNETRDGIDSHFQVNHLSQMHLILTLLPNLHSTPRSRLVLQSSDLHRAAPSSIKFASLTEINTDIGPSYLYNRTKLAQVLFIRALKRRMDSGALGFTQHAGKENLLYANATHPGAVNTDQQEQAAEAYGTLGKVAVAASRTMMADPVKQGCKPALFAATAEDVVKEGIVGEYIVPDRKVTAPSSQAQDVELGESLWKLSLEVLKEKLGKLDYDA